MQILLFIIDATFLAVVGGSSSAVFKLVAHCFARRALDCDWGLMWTRFWFAYTRPEASAVLETRP